MSRARPASARSDTVEARTHAGRSSLMTGRELNAVPGSSDVHGSPISSTATFAEGRDPLRGAIGASTGTARLVSVAAVAALAVTACDRTPLPPWSQREARAGALVRVNQVGYLAAGVKSARFLARGKVGDVKFRVVDDAARTAFGPASIGPHLGRWEGADFEVYDLDFTAFAPTSTGTYHIEMVGGVGAASPAFLVGTATDLYAPLLAKTQRFFAAQRDGRNVDAKVLNRRPAHLNDERARVYEFPRYRGSEDSFVLDQPDLVAVPGEAPRDVSGGWADAGDYVKFVATSSFTTVTLLSAARDFPGQLGAQPADFRAEGHVGIDWLRKMWDDSRGTLYYQVGIGDGNDGIAADHAVWRLPEADDSYGGADPKYRYLRNRPVFRAGPPGTPVSPNLAGRLAAAFGLCAQVYRSSDPALANECLASGEHVLAQAATDGGGGLLTTSPHGYYEQTEWKSDMELGAAELARALQAAGSSLPASLPQHDAGYYLLRAATFANGAINEAAADPPATTLDLYNVRMLAHASLHRALTAAGGDVAGPTVRCADLVTDMAKQLERARTTAKGDPFRLAASYAEIDTVPHALGVALTADLYESIAGGREFRSLANQQLDWILGSNVRGVSFVVGAGTTFPRCPHHQIANLVGSLDGTGTVLEGAFVEGPMQARRFVDRPEPTDDGQRACPPRGDDVYRTFSSPSARYQDNVADVSTANEPAIDIAAMAPLLLAGLIARR